MSAPRQLASAADLSDRIADWRGERRCIVAVAGPPGCGKSTIAKQLAADLNGRSAGSTAIMPMDGYHFDDTIIEHRGLRQRKGAPETFDVAGFVHTIRRVRQDDDPEIAIPVFDRSIEIARAGAGVICKSVRTIIVEGNYLLLDRLPWTALEFDITAMVDAERAVLRERLINRWLDLGFSVPEAKAKVDGNDMLNVDVVRNGCRSADLYLST